jgi:hypothetical protein
MPNTFNRQPFSVSTGYSEKIDHFMHADFKGISDNKNDVTVDQFTFADAKNVYVDEQNILTSRPPFKFSDGEAYIVDQWTFGPYCLRLYRVLMTKYTGDSYWPYLIKPTDWMPGDNWPTGLDSLDRPFGIQPRGYKKGDDWPYPQPVDGMEYIVTNPKEYPVSSLYFTFILECTTHDTADFDDYMDKYVWKVNVSSIGWDFIPKVTCVQIEDKIFIWFGGIDFIAFNTSGIIHTDGKNYKYFEDATKYLYFPIHKVVINGIESDLETKNFLTDRYRKRYQYSTFSSVNFDKLIGRDLRVGLNGKMTDGKSKHLYDIKVGDKQSNMIVYPYSPIGNDYQIDVVQTPRTNVILKYNIARHTIEISFDGKSYRVLPELNNILGTPMLTRDGLYAIAFTTQGVAKCKLVAQETSDFVSENDVFVWHIDKYMRNTPTSISNQTVDEIDASFIPSGYFETIDNFAYIFKAKSILSTITGETQYLYAQCLIGNDTIFICKPLITVYGTDDDINWANILPSDNIKIHFSYVTPTVERPDLGPVISIMTNGMNKYVNGTLTQQKAGILTYCLKRYQNNLYPEFVVCDDEGVYQDVSIIVRHDDCVYFVREYAFPCSQMDIKNLTTIVGIDKVIYKYAAGYSLKGTMLYDNIIHYFIDDKVMYDGKVYKCIKNNKATPVTDTTCWTKISDNTNGYEETKIFDSYVKNNITYTIEGAGLSSYSYGGPINYDGYSRFFKVSVNGESILTDKYLWINNSVLTLPSNGMLSNVIEDKERIVINDDELQLINPIDSTVYSGNIYKLSSDLLSLSAGSISSGDWVSYTANAVTEADYLRPGEFGGTPAAPIGLKNNRFLIDKIAADNGNWKRISGNIKSGDLIRLTAYAVYITVPAGNPGNPFNVQMTIQPYEYPAAPTGWQVGDDWPTDWPVHKPLIPTSDNTVRLWAPGDPLPTGNIRIFGIANIVKKTRPLKVDTNGVWYNIDGTLWTSELTEGNIVELDEYINDVNVRTDVPDCFATLNEHYFSFTTKEGHNLLEVTSTRRDEERFFNEKTMDFLLYLPERNEQKFANKITNIHPLSENTMGIFTENDIWYVQSVTLSDDTIAYTKPIKSKIPVGCREGDDIITALDGKALIFPTARGLAAMAPENFIATDENTLSYLSDTIQDKYNRLYTDVVKNVSFVPNDFETGYKSAIKILTYKYWILVYKYMSRDILAFDTRSATWWNWETPYPIKSMTVNSKLYVLMEVDFTPLIPYTNPEVRKDNASMLGVSFVFEDEYKDVTYYDDIVENSISGVSKSIYENEFVGNRRVIEYASPIINWYILSQKLHFNNINNYKSVYGININLIGNEKLIAKLSTKIYRDKYHPENNVNLEIDVNEIRTFVKRLNLMHVIRFQYKFENDSTLDKILQKPLKLNSLSIKYAIKEGIR